MLFCKGDKPLTMPMHKIIVFAILLTMMCGTIQGITSGPHSQRKVRQAAVAGQFYSADPVKLKADVAAAFRANAAVRPVDGVQAVIVPHAGYVFSARVAAAAYAAIAPTARYERIILLGPSHCVYLNKASVATLYRQYDTPLGRVEVDTAACDAIEASSSVFTCDERAHSREHCLEVQLPLLQSRLKTMPPIVPIVVATSDVQQLQRIAQALKPYFNEKNLFVISSDFSHYPSCDDARVVDKATGQAVMTGRCDDFVKALDRNRARGIDSLVTSACGEAAIATLLLMSQGDQSVKIKHAAYSNSGDSPYGSRDRVVGYHSFVFYREPSPAVAFSLTEADKQELKKIARASIESAFGRPAYVPGRLSPALQCKCGAFVTLNKCGRLRGCIGHFGQDVPLYKIVEHMARAAAFEDPRFDRLRRDELDSIEIEISVLTPMRRIHDISEFKLHRDGIYIKKGSRAGTFLPQVADEVNWTKEEFLGHCSRDKAGLGWDGWRTAQLYTYQAIVF